MQGMVELIKTVLEFVFQSGGKTSLPILGEENIIDIQQVK